MYHYICINGELKSFFPRSKGVTRGDPMLPYLFVLVMEAFSRLMDRMFKRAYFRFHWRCHRQKISHICFADDLLILSRGKINFVAMVKGVLELF
jgi:hypothetical protein